MLRALWAYAPALRDTGSRTSPSDQRTDTEMARLRLCEGDVGTDSVLMRVCTVLSASLLYTVPAYTLEMEGASVEGSVLGRC